MDKRLTPRAERMMEELWNLQREAIEILGVVNAEWKTDPDSVQCFDLRIVQRTREVVERIEFLRNEVGDV